MMVSKDTGGEQISRYLGHLYEVEEHTDGLPTQDKVHANGNKRAMIWGSPGVCGEAEAPIILPEEVPDARPRTRVHLFDVACYGGG